MRFSNGSTRTVRIDFERVSHNSVLAVSAPALGMNYQL